MAGCGCGSYAANPLSKGCSQKARSKNIGRLISEGYDARQAAAIAYSTQRKAGCKVPKRKAKRNPPYGVYGVQEQFQFRFGDIGSAADFAREWLQRGVDDKVVVYDEARMDRGPKGEFVAMFRPNAGADMVEKFGRLYKRGTKFGCCNRCGAVMELGAKGGDTYWRDNRLQYCDGCKPGSPHVPVDGPFGYPGWCSQNDVAGVYYGGEFKPTQGSYGGSFVANKKGGKKKRRKKGKRRSYKSNPGVAGLAVLGLAAVGGWWIWKTYGGKVKSAVTTATTATTGAATASQPVISVRPRLF